ncbi:DUF3311 domain-containing protein [Nocardia sp. CA2R105]|uniref:DUF3311 domain-containing protein n=1 Tax=Nocardia coffeae TaxID=2873381 RepID=UPI001CA61798|nr:DUF3311 domain-containing protein [Nocardia coffeae]MBY8861393.1 DUF3311 domain-containing protein [Nocardia coffeae]
MKPPDHPTAPPPAASQHTSASLPKWVICALLITAPVVLSLAVPLYQRSGPAVAGIPFFYWFQMAMAVAAAAGCGTVYLIAFRHEAEGADAQ